MHWKNSKTRTKLYYHKYILSPLLPSWCLDIIPPFLVLGNIFLPSWRLNIIPSFLVIGNTFSTPPFLVLGYNSFLLGDWKYFLPFLVLGSIFLPSWWLELFSSLLGHGDYFPPFLVLEINFLPSWWVDFVVCIRSGGLRHDCEVVIIRAFVCKKWGWFPAIISFLRFGGP